MAVAGCCSLNSASAGRVRAKYRRALHSGAHLPSALISCIISAEKAEKPGGRGDLEGGPNEEYQSEQVDISSAPGLPLLANHRDLALRTIRSGNNRRLRPHIPYPDV